MRATRLPYAGIANLRNASARQRTIYSCLSHPSLLFSDGHGRAQPAAQASPRDVQAVSVQYVHSPPAETQTLGLGSLTLLSVAGPEIKATTMGRWGTTERHPLTHTPNLTTQYSAGHHVSHTNNKNDQQQGRSPARPCNRASLLACVTQPPTAAIRSVVAAVAVSPGLADKAPGRGTNISLPPTAAHWLGHWRAVLTAPNESYQALQR
ncbi:hypothetical protein G7Z17_g6704 [Cylindrodendrum hubeiense]|uniref:Uncharacterized protein n=1 Tax=Cylindrodendrum hubeiense TaxID=595255 RepID=A0A9P5H9C6_9HYPO|nr:hypothetical protein G7Z17_g6704 [Cylindrodendrum hubeiense]